MRYMLYSGICFIGLSLYAGDYTPGQYDVNFQCIIDINGLCETEYVEEVLELSKGCDITTPEKAEVSDFEAWCRRLGIKLWYKYEENPLELVAYAAAIASGSYFLIRRFVRR